MGGRFETESVADLGRNTQWRTKGQAATKVNTVYYVVVRNALLKAVVE